MTYSKKHQLRDKPRKKYKFKSRRQLLDEECKFFMRHIVRMRDGGCVTPGKKCSPLLTASHWQPATQQRTKYDIRNVNCQCSNCNERHNHYQSFYNEYMLSTYGYEVCLEISQLASVPKWKWSIGQLQEIRDELEKMFKKYLDKNPDYLKRYQDYGEELK